MTDASKHEANKAAEVRKAADARKAAEANRTPVVSSAEAVSRVAEANKMAAAMKEPPPPPPGAVRSDEPSIRLPTGQPAANVEPVAEVKVPVFDPVTGMVIEDYKPNADELVKIAETGKPHGETVVVTAQVVQPRVVPEPVEPPVSPQTKAEMEAGRKAIAGS